MADDRYKEILAAFEGVPDNRPRKVAIVGSRAFRRPEWVVGYVNRLPPDWTVVSGGAYGVDTWAEAAAVRRGLAVEVYRPDWKAHGKAAGAIRNRQIVEAADWVVAFWDGESKGTAITMELARKAGKLRGTYTLRPGSQAPENTPKKEATNG
jgi:hypothetical protein